MDSHTYILAQGAPGLLNLLLPVYRFHILVNGPGMLFDRLRVLTSLDMQAGYTFDAVETFARELEVTALCGNTGVQEVKVEAVSSRIGMRVEFGVGPTGMYQSELILRTRSDRPFDEVLRRIFRVPSNHSFLFALEPMPGTGHHHGTHPHDVRPHPQHHS
jgi:hypothetical protein